MRKIILQMMMTVDGYISGPNDELDWVDNDPEMGEVHLDLAKRADAALMDYDVYQGMAGYWSNAEKNPNPDGPANEVAFAKVMNTMKKIVIMTKDEPLDWSNTASCLVKDTDDMVAKVKELKDTPGEYLLLYGWAETAQTLMENGLVDEFILDICPIALGSGVPLFKERTPLQFVDVKTYKSGAMTVRYKKK
jgi:dihydrofolate reductase